MRSDLKTLRRCRKRAFLEIGGNVCHVTRGVRQRDVTVRAHQVERIALQAGFFHLLRPRKNMERQFPFVAEGL